MKRRTAAFEVPIEEYESYKKLAAEAGVSLSEWLRQRVRSTLAEAPEKRAPMAGPVRVPSDSPTVPPPAHPCAYASLSLGETLCAKKGRCRWPAGLATQCDLYELRGSYARK